MVIINRVCEIEGCGGVKTARGLCHKHYSRYRRNGFSKVGIENPKTTRKDWTAEEDAALLACKAVPIHKHYEALSELDALAFTLGRSKASLLERLRTLDVDFLGSAEEDGHWQEWEDEILAAHIEFPKVPPGTWPDVWQKHFSGRRTFNATRTRVCYLRKKMLEESRA